MISHELTGKEYPLKNCKLLTESDYSLGMENTLQLGFQRDAPELKCKTIILCLATVCVVLHQGRIWMTARIHGELKFQSWKLFGY